MRDTVFCLVRGRPTTTPSQPSIDEMVARVQAYVPGYRLKQEVQFDRDRRPTSRVRIPELGRTFTGLKVSVFLEVEGAGALPARLRRQPRHHDLGRACSVAERIAASTSGAAHDGAA